MCGKRIPRRTQVAVRSKPPGAPLCTTLDFSGMSDRENCHSK